MVLNSNRDLGEELIECFTEGVESAFETRKEVCVCVCVCVCVGVGVLMYFFR